MMLTLLQLSYRAENLSWAYKLPHFAGTGRRLAQVYMGFAHTHPVKMACGLCGAPLFIMGVGAVRRVDGRHRFRMRNPC